MQDKRDYIDIYCERVSGDFLAEPLNAITNLGFILVGLFILKGQSFSGRILGVITILVGLGSLTFHTFATTWAAALDVGFIALFILVFAYLVPLKLWNLSVVQSVLCAALVIGVVFFFDSFTPEFKKLFGYFPPGIYVGAWLSLVSFGLISNILRVKEATRWIFFAIYLFPLSLLTRELDLAFCDTFPFGTHWLWHLLNSLVLGFCSFAFHTQYKKVLKKI